MRPRTALAVAFVAFVAIAWRTLEAPVDWREERIPAVRGAIRDHAGRIVARDGPDGRAYAFGRLGAHTIGDVASGPSGDVIGCSGVEASFDDVLRGRHGVRRVPVDADGHALEGVETLAEPIAGSDLTLTIDMALVQSIDRAFAHRHGAAVVVDVHDGSVRALFSAPTADPQASGTLVDRTIGRALPPGGTFKTLTVLAGLEAGIDPSATVECEGTYELRRGERPFHCSGAHGLVDARAALARTCSAYAWSVADRVGLDALRAVARDFGLGAPTGIALRFEASGRLPTAGADPTVDAMLAATGVDGIEVTPLQLAMAYAAIANGGTLWRPRLVSTEPPQAHRVRASVEHLVVLRDALTGVVEDERGTAYDRRSVRIRVAGKTGHAEGARPFEPLGWWFAGFAPADDPEIAVVVFVDGHDRLEPVEIAVHVIEDWLGAGRTP